jgi:hypothetical protein
MSESSAGEVVESLGATCTIPGATTISSDLTGCVQGRARRCCLHSTREPLSLPFTPRTATEVTRSPRYSQLGKAVNPLRWYFQAQTWPFQGPFAGTSGRFGGLWAARTVDQDGHQPTSPSLTAFGRSRAANGDTFCLKQRLEALRRRSWA